MFTCQLGGWYRLRDLIRYQRWSALRDAGIQTKLTQQNSCPSWTNAEMSTEVQKSRSTWQEHSEEPDWRSDKERISVSAYQGWEKQDWAEQGGKLSCSHSWGPSHRGYGALRAPQSCLKLRRGGWVLYPHGSVIDCQLLPEVPWATQFPSETSRSRCELSVPRGLAAEGWDPRSWMRSGQHGIVMKPTGWRRKWQPTPVFLTAESHGQGSLAGYGVAKGPGHGLATERQWRQP